MLQHTKHNYLLNMHLPKWPQWSQPPGSHTLLSSPPLWVWTRPSNLLLINKIQKIYGFTFNMGYKRLWLSTFFLLPFLLLGLMKQAAMLQRHSTKTPMWQGTKGSLWPTIHEDPKSQSNSLLGNDPVNNHVEDLGRKSLPGKPWGDCKLVKDPQQKKKKKSS